MKKLLAKVKKMERRIKKQEIYISHLKNKQYSINKEIIIAEKICWDMEVELSNFRKTLDI